MNNVGIHSANLIYGYAAAPRIQRHVVSHDLFMRFSRSLRLLEHQLGEGINEEYWDRILSWLKRYRFNMTASPLPFNWRDPGTRLTATQIEESVTRCRYLHPEIAGHLEHVFALWKQLNSCTDKPYFKVMEQLWPNTGFGDVLFLVRDSRLVMPVAELISKRWGNPAANSNVLSVSQLDRSRIADSVVLFGPMRWFPEHLFTAPRAYRTHLINYRWVVDQIDFEPAFVSNTSVSYQVIYEESKALSALDPEADHRPTPLEVVSLTPDELVPSINWQLIAQRLPADDSDEETYREYVEAYLLILAGEGAVFVDASDSATTLIIDLEDEYEEYEDDASSDDGHLGRLKSSQLVPGQFMLLRTEGSGDFIIPIANRLLGSDLAAKARASQIRWKTELRKRVYRKGLFESSIELLDLGSIKANETNLRNWMSAKSIRPHDVADFKAIMRFVGLENEFSEVDALSKQILSAHRRAGQSIRRQLLAQVQKSDLGKLRTDGQMEFVLPDADGGSLTALRIEGISPRKFEVPTSRLDTLMDVEDILWQK